MNELQYLVRIKPTFISNKRYYKVAICYADKEYSFDVIGSTTLTQISLIILKFLGDEKNKIFS